MKKYTAKVPYICGPLTELKAKDQNKAKLFYQHLADVCEKTLSTRAFVPHEHYDPIKHAAFTPADVDRAERYQVGKLTSLLIVVAIAPSWGGGIEVEIANKSGVPIVILCEKEKLQNKKISRLLRGNPAVIDILTYTKTKEALEKLQLWLKKESQSN